VQAGDRVEKCSERKFDVLVDEARSPDVLHQIGAGAFQGAVNPLQDIQRLALIVDGVARRDDVE
jgi:hypothetical protein